MNQAKKYTGSCFCGAVEFALEGQPEVMGYCHCESCRHWSAGQVNAFTLWPTDSFSITQGAGNLGEYDKIADQTGAAGPSNRKWCQKCGGHVFIAHPTMGLTDVPAVLVKDFAFKPAFHVHYQETVQPMRDGLPKFKDMPEAAGGSGEELPE